MNHECLGVTRRTPFQALRIHQWLVSPISQVGLWPWSQLIPSDKWVSLTGVLSSYRGPWEAPQPKNRNHTCLLYNWEVFCSLRTEDRPTLSPEGCTDMLTFTGSPFISADRFLLIGSRTICLPKVRHIPSPRAQSRWPDSRSVGGALGQLIPHMLSMHTDKIDLWALGPQICQVQRLKGHQSSSFVKAQVKEKRNQAWPSWGLSITPVFLGCVLAGKILRWLWTDPFWVSFQASPSQTDFTTFDSPSEPRQYCVW